MSHTVADEQLAILGGPLAVPDSDQHDGLFRWPIVTDEDEQAVLDVLRRRTMSDIDITTQFEAEYARYNGSRYALSYPNGTLALQVAMWAAGLRRGDEMICPSVTYWASAAPALALGAAVAFADIDPVSLCLDPGDIQRHIGPRSKAIMVVHYCGHPADMDPILEIAQRHNLAVIEDVSHAHGALYKGRMVGSFGNVSATSMMTLKSFAIGEAGMLLTDDQEIHQRAIAFAHYRRHDQLTLSEVKPFSGVPLGAIKGRLNQTCAAMGRVQLKYYQERIVEIQKAMNYFWDLLEDVPGLRAHRPAPGSGSTMGGWYNPQALYVPEELGGLAVEKFIDAVQAEGSVASRGINFPLHQHPTFTEADIYGDGQPTQQAQATRDVGRPAGSLPVSEAACERALGIPWFKHYRPEIIEQYAAAYRKVALQASKLEASDG